MVGSQVCRAGMYLTSDNSGRLYTTESVWGNEPKHYIALVTCNDGVFTNYERLKINPYYGNQTHPCIAPDGSFIIYDTNDDISTMFISFKDKNGNLSESINLTQYGIMKDAGEPTFLLMENICFSLMMEIFGGYLQKLLKS